MPNEPYKPIICISYAHADEPETPAEGEVKWLSFVTGYLRPAIKHGAVKLWIDRLMPGGADWEREIERKLRACDIFILLVSRHSLSSDYVVDKEIKIIRERQAKGEPVHFYPLVLTPTPKIALDRVHDKNLRPRDGKPLSDYSLNERYRRMSDAADEIAEIAGEIAAFTTLKNSASGLASSIAIPSQQSTHGEVSEFVRSTPRSVYVSYRRTDDEPPPRTSGDGFVSHLRKELMWELKQLGARAHPMRCFGWTKLKSRRVTLGMTPVTIS